MEKKFLLYYEPASLRKYPHRWTITFAQLDPQLGRVVNITKTFNINRIRDERVRLRRANEIIEYLNSDLLPKGYPFVQDLKEDFDNIQQKSLLDDAIEFAYQVRTRGKSGGSLQTYRNQFKTFQTFLEKERINIPVSDFSKRQAQMYIDYLKVKRKLGARAFNNHLGFMKGLFAILEEREYLFKNPFDGFKREAKPESWYRIFSEAETRIVAQRIYETDIWLFRAILLMYQCYIRKVELTRLRFNMFDMQRGLIRMPMGIVRKNKKVNTRTIPQSIMKYFLQTDFLKQPANYLVFGAGFKPSLTSCSVNTPTTRHKAIITKLHKEGLIDDPKGLHLYSWKFTGITANLEHMDLQHVSTQAGHSDVSITMGYRRAPEVNKAFKDILVDPLK